MMPATLATIALCPAGFCRPQWRTAVPGGLVIDDQFESRKALNGKIGRLGATQNPTGVASSAVFASGIGKTGARGPGVFFE